MYLFVSGCPRSGTTALTRLINLHPAIVVGLERYKGRFGEGAELQSEMFTQEAFFDFKPGDTNFQPGHSEEANAFYEKAKQKYPDAKFVGDKYPQFFRRYGSLFKVFPDAKIIFIVRDPIHVAQSWQRRSEDSTGWPAKNDARRAISYWNDALAYTLAYSQIKKSAFTFVDYDQFFAARDEGLFELFRWIGAELTPEMQTQISVAAAPEFARSEVVLGREISLDNATLQEVGRQTDRNLYRRAQKIIEGQRMKSPTAD